MRMPARVSTSKAQDKLAPTHFGWIRFIFAPISHSRRRVAPDIRKTQLVGGCKFYTSTHRCWLRFVRPEFKPPICKKSITTTVPPPNVERAFGLPGTVK